MSTPVTQPAPVKPLTDLEQAGGYWIGGMWMRLSVDKEMREFYHRCVRPLSETPSEIARVAALKKSQNTEHFRYIQQKHLEKDGGLYGVCADVLGK